MYNLIGTALLNDLNPDAYLRHVFEWIAGLRVSRIDKLPLWPVKDALAAETASAYSHGRLKRWRPDA